MELYRYLTFNPEIASGVYLAPGVKVIGRAKFGEDSSVWHNSVVRADVNQIIIGARTNVQDLSMLHVTEENELIIGAEVSIGHSVTLHGCTIGASCLIGMGSIILDGAKIGEYSLVAAGTLIPPGKIFPARSYIMGNPCKILRELTDQEVLRVANHYKSYIEYKNTYLSMS